MHKTITATLLATLTTLAAPASAEAPFRAAFAALASDLQHGGGCRKSSPAGQCCHMQTSVGVVHCH